MSSKIKIQKIFIRYSYLLDRLALFSYSPEGLSPNLIHTKCVTYSIGKNKILHCTLLMKRNHLHFYQIEITIYKRLVNWFKLHAEVLHDHKKIRVRHLLRFT